MKDITLNGRRIIAGKMENLGNQKRGVRSTGVGHISIAAKSRGATVKGLSP
jgi:hypothetical protein